MAMRQDIRFDEELSKLDASLRSEDNVVARLQLAAFELQLSGYVSGEERVLFPAFERLDSTPRAYTETMRKEHGSMRCLVTRIWAALDRADHRRGLELVGALRSVLLLHVTKEDWFLYPPHSRARKARR
ncbi:MAG: hemerythrin cation-binding protein [Myxococcales bacterium]|nr:hemerythrin cation-binding protein [Myxococcales bacterium]